MDYSKPLLMSKPVKSRLKLLSQNLNFVPRNVIDIGAYEGYWSIGFKEIFPDCNIFMIEGDEDKTEILNKRQIPYEIALLSDKEKTTTFYKTKHMYTTGNSIYKENSNSFSGNEYYSVQILTKTLDKVVENHNLTDIDIIKIDVQGAEKDIIMGGIRTIRSCKAVILELSLVEYNQGAPLILEMLNFMDQLSFKIHDIIELHYDHISRLTQIDIIFIHK